MAAITQTDPLGKVRRVLSKVVLISQEELAKLSADQTQALLLESSDLPKQVVPSFKPLTNKKAISAKLLAGKDVSVELEFNGISVSRDQEAALAIVRPLLSSIEGIPVSYPWVDPTEACTNINFLTKHITRPGGAHKITILKAKALWMKASPYWAGIRATAPNGTYESYDGYNRRPDFYMDRVVIGCQTIQRNELEFVARHFDWPLPEAKEK